MRSYLIGNAVRSTVRFRTPGGALVDPTAIIAKVRNPALAITTYTYGVDILVVRDSAGVYRIDVALNAAGEWHVRWEATGTNQAAVEHAFLCTASTF